MTQHDLEKAVCTATGEELHEVRRLGFSLADPVDINFDPEPMVPLRVIDWDDFDLRRNLAILPYRRHRQ